jgi:hypothetical protein
MAFDDNTFETDILTAVSGSGNTNTNNSTNVAVDLETVGNVDNSTHDSGNLNLGITDSFKNDSGNESWDIDDSGNTGSYNLDVTVVDESVTDNSVNAGVREYNTGLTGELALGGGGGGDVMVNNQNTIVDQSLNANVLSGGGVFQVVDSDSILASGDGAAAAGGDITMHQSLDASTNIDAGGDVLIDSEKNVDVAIGSNNTTTVDVEVTDASTNWDIDDSGNSYSAVLDIEGSFTETDTSVDYDDWDVDADVIWDSTVTDIGNVDIDV